MNRPCVVLDHVGQKEPVKIQAPGRFEFLQLLLREHTRHMHNVIAGAMHHQGYACDVDLGHRLSAIAEPLLHEGNFILLRINDTGSQCLHLCARTVSRSQFRHDKGLCVVGDHARHEVGIGLGEFGEGAIQARPVERFQLDRRGPVGMLRYQAACAATGRRGKHNQQGGNPIKMLHAFCPHVEFARQVHSKK